MIELKVFDNLEQAMQLYAELGDKLAPEMSMALNRAARGVKTDVSRYIVSQRGIKRDEVKDWKFQNAKPGDFESLAVIRGRRLGLENFGPNPNKPMEGTTSGGVTVNIMGKSTQFRHAFAHDLWSKKYRQTVGGQGDIFIMQRKRGARPKRHYDSRGRRLIGRFPLYKLTAVSVPQIADDDDVVDMAVRSVGGRFLSQFDHLIDRLIKEAK